MPLRFTFRQLEYMVAVGEAGTVALAAQTLNVSSPSISAAISQLEAEFGIQIFVRHHGQGLALTPGGRRVFNEARRILDSAHGLNDLAQDITNMVRGPLAIGAFNTLAPYVLAPLRRSFEAAFADADVTQRVGNQVELLQMLGRAEIDVALTYDLDIPKDVGFTALIELPPHVMLPVGHDLAGRESLSLAEVAGEPMVLLDLPLSREYFLNVFQTAGIRPNIAERASDMAVVRSLVANGFGYSLGNVRGGMEAGVVMVPLEDDLRPMVVGLATKQTDHPSRLLSAFFEHVSAAVAANGVPGLG